MSLTPWPTLPSGQRYLGAKKGEPNILALIASQPYSAFHSSATLTLPLPARRTGKPYPAHAKTVTIWAITTLGKLYLLTANLAKSLKCYTPHAEVTSVYTGGLYSYGPYSYWPVSLWPT